MVISASSPSSSCNSTRLRGIRTSSSSRPRSAATSCSTTHSNWWYHASSTTACCAPTTCSSQRRAIVRREGQQASSSFEALFSSVQKVFLNDVKLGQNEVLIFGDSFHFRWNVFWKGQKQNKKQNWLCP